MGKSWRKMLVLLGFFFAFCACTPDVSNSILNGKICGISCWNNITVGETDKVLFLDEVRTIPNVDQTSIKIVTLPNGKLFDERITLNYYRIMNNEDTLVNISARMKNQRIIYVIFQGDLGLTFREVEDIFGKPDLVSSLWTFDGGINVHFIYSSQGLAITTYFSSERQSISPTTKIFYLSMFDPDLYPLFLEADLLTADHDFFILYPWSGYGMIEEYYWPPNK